MTSITLYLQSEKFDTARFELHQLLGQPNLTGVPLLVVCITSNLALIVVTNVLQLGQLGNKNDVDGHASVKDLIRAL